MATHTSTPVGCPVLPHQATLTAWHHSALCSIINERRVGGDQLRPKPCVQHVTPVVLSAQMFLSGLGPEFPKVQPHLAADCHCVTGVLKMLQEDHLDVWIWTAGDFSWVTERTKAQQHKLAEERLLLDTDCRICKVYQREGFSLSLFGPWRKVYHLTHTPRPLHRPTLK